jgi:hypothetical protein
MFGGTVCLDDFGAAGRAGDVVGVYSCVPGAASQAWTLASDGTLIGVNGLCVAAGATGASLTLQACDGSAAQRWTASASTSRSTTPLVSAASGQCLATAGGRSTAATASTVTACASGAADQAISVPGVGTPGQILLFSGTMCLDDFGAQGQVGDVVGVYTCVPGAASQVWTLTSGGALTGVNGLCVAASGTSVTLQRCDGSAGQKWTSSGGAGRLSVPLVNAGGSQCMGTQNASANPATPATLETCVTGAGDQTISVPAIGTAGQVLLFSGSMCLDDFGAAGRAGDVIGVYTCVAGAESQRWTLTSAGALTGVNGLCVGASGTNVTLQACDASAGQHWSTSAPAGTPANATPSGGAAVFGFLGAAPSVASVQARGGVWARYESDFATYAESHWASEGASYDNADYYDRAMIYYMWWARTGNATYLDRANQLAINARTYIESAGYYPQPYLMMIDGVALHALITGDQRSLATVGKAADALMSPPTYWANVVGQTSNGDMDSRTQARLLGVLLDAWYLHAPSAQGNDWGVRLRDVLTRILGSQSADGAYRWPDQCSYNKPFMDGMLNDALIRYHTTFEADARIVPAVKRSVDYMWANDWLPSSQSFTYLEGTCSSEVPGAAADLNNMIVSGFAFVARQTGDASYYTKGDAVFAGGVSGSWLVGSKQFNQEYTTSYRYLGLRW